MKKIYYFCFQVLFFAVSVFALHFALFDFYSADRYEMYARLNSREPVFYSSLPILTFDLIIGIGIGFLNASCSTLAAESLAEIKKAIIFTDVIWVLFCFWWYFNNRGAINTEGIGHIISPFVVGFVGSVFALLNLAYFLSLRRANKQNIVQL